MLGSGDQKPGGDVGAASLGGWTRSWNWPPVLRSTEWVGGFEGHEFRVVTRGILRARLYIDSELRDARCPLLCRDCKVPLLSGRIPTSRPEVTIVHVYRRGLLPMRVDVRVAGTSVPMTPHASARDER